MRKTSALAAAAAAVLLGLGACGGDEPADDASPGAGLTDGASPGAGATADAPAEEAVLATADTDLGTVVVDGSGMTVYVFDKDTAGSGKSACAGQCLANWPPVVADSADPVVDGVDGEVGTITRDDGTLQLTLEGYPLYLWQGDSAPGDTTGQGVQGVWWVVAPDGTKVSATTSPAALPGY